MTIAREEIFGPVLCIIPYKDEDDAIRIANDTPYGLSGYVSSEDPEHALSVARKIRSGNVHINNKPTGIDAPFGGFKHSGIGREAGEHGLQEFLEVKSVGGWTYIIDLFLTPSKKIKHFFNSSSSINSSILCACSIEPGPQTTVLIPIS